MSFGIIDKSLEGRQRLFFPHYCAGKVPTDKEANRRWRQKAFTLTDERDRRALKRMASEDFLFYIAGFVYLFDAGDESGSPGPVPFIPFEFQVEALTRIYECLHDTRMPVRIKKPRKMGFTYQCLWILEHAWHFRKDCHILIGSHREEEVDGTVNISKGGQFAGEWSKLLPKIDFGHIHMPRWMLPKGFIPRVEPYRSRMKMMNPEKGGIIWGTSAARASGHGERGYAAMWDECSKTDNLYDIIGGLSEFAPVKLWVSTIGDLGHPFSTILRTAPGVDQMEVQWWMHPDYAKGMTIDTESGERTSPWLEKKLDAIGRDAMLANQQYFGDETVQIGGFYHPKCFEAMNGISASVRGGGIYDHQPTVMDPIHIGELDAMESKDGPYVSRFVEQPNGQWSFWCEFDESLRPSRSTRYIIGCDIAAGTRGSDGRGASNSVIVVIDWLTGEVVAEYVTHGVEPSEFAKRAYAAGHWFEGDDFAPAIINFERNGPAGASFGRYLVEELHYPKVWATPDGKKGWYKGGNEETQKAFGLHQQLICERKLIERSRSCVDEMQCYQNPKTGTGPPVHTASLYTKDPSGARENHGDRVIARVVACLVLQYPYQVRAKLDEAPYGSMRYVQHRRNMSRYQEELI